MRAGRPPAGWWLLVPVLAWGCDNAEECGALERIRDQLKTLSSRVKARVALGERVQSSVERQKTAALEARSKLQLDLPEERITELLKERLDGVSGVSMERDTMPARHAALGTETIWRYDLEARPTERLFELLDRLIASPPLTHFRSLQRTEDGYQMVLKRVEVGEFTGQMPTPPRPELPDPEAVPSTWFGTCGASALRQEIAQLKETYVEHLEEAEAAAAAVARGATYQGLYRRVVQTAEQELRARRTVSALLTAAEAAKLPWIGLGSEEGTVVLDVQDKPGVKSRLEKQLDMGLLTRMQVAKVQLSPDQGTAPIKRFVFPDSRRSVMGPSGGDHDHDHGPGFGLPSPEMLKEKLLEMESQTSQGGDAKDSTK